jgi:hypothetical protein
MGCVLQPGEDLPTSALKPGDTTSNAVQPGQEIDVCGPPASIFTLTVDDFVQATEGSDPTAFGEMAAGWQAQNNGFVFSFEWLDSNVGMPDETQFFGVTNWVDDKAIGGFASTDIIYCRFQQTGGSGTLGFGSSPMNTWLRMSGPAPQGNLVILVSPAGAGFEDWQGTVELSRDMVVIEDSATIQLSTNQTGP